MNFLNFTFDMIEKQGIINLSSKSSKIMHLLFFVILRSPFLEK